jgi:hypothetical protein
LLKIPLFRPIELYQRATGLQGLPGSLPILYTSKGIQTPKILINGFAAGRRPFIFLRFKHLILKKIWVLSYWKRL